MRKKAITEPITVSTDNYPIEIKLDFIYYCNTKLCMAAIFYQANKKSRKCQFLYFPFVD